MTNSWYVDKESALDLMKGLPFGLLKLSKWQDPYFNNYNQYVSSAFNGASYVIVIFYEHKEDHNKNMLHIKVYSSKLGIDKGFDVEKFQYGDHEKLMKLMKKVLLY